MYTWEYKSQCNWSRRQTKSSDDYDNDRILKLCNPLISFRRSYVAFLNEKKKGERKILRKPELVKFYKFLLKIIRNRAN